MKTNEGESLFSQRLNEWDLKQFSNKISWFLIIKDIIFGCFVTTGF